MQTDESSISKAGHLGQPVDLWLCPLVLISMFVTFFAIARANVCACGHATPGSLMKLGPAMLFPWILFVLPGRRHLITRGLTLIAVIAATAAFGYALVDVVWFSPHAGH